MDAETRKLVWYRAHRCCGYCRLAQEYEPFLRFQVEHIISRPHSGDDDLSNLAFACRRRNLHKGPNLAGGDPLTGRGIQLFHPWHDGWADHFRWRGDRLIGQTPIGRTTVRVLDANAFNFEVNCDFNVNFQLIEV